MFVLDADNQIYPRCLARLSEFVSDGEYDAAYSQQECFGSAQRIGWADVWEPARFREGNYVDAMALVSRRAWRVAGGYRHLEGGAEDYDFWCSFVDLGLRAIFVPEILGRYRVHEASMLRTQTGQAWPKLRVELTGRHPWLRLP